MIIGFHVDIWIFSEDYLKIDFKLAVNNFLGTEETRGSEIVDVGLWPLWPAQVDVGCDVDVRLEPRGTRDNITSDWASSGWFPTSQFRLSVRRCCRVTPFRPLSVIAVKQKVNLCLFHKYLAFLALENNWSDLLWLINKQITWEDLILLRVSNRNVAVFVFLP